MPLDPNDVQTIQSMISSALAGRSSGGGITHREIKKLERRLRRQIQAVEVDQYVEAESSTVQGLEAFTSNTVSPGSRGLVTTTGRVYIAATATVGGSTWEPVDGEHWITDYGVNETNTGTVNSDRIDEMAASVGAGVYYVPRGTFPLNRQFDLPSGSELFGEGHTSILDFTGATGTFPDFACVHTTGNAVLLPDLGADVSEGDTQITFLSDPSLSEDDIFVLRETTPGSFNPIRNQYFAGEWFRAVSRSGVDVTIDAATYDSYLAASAHEIHRVDATTVQIRDLFIQGIGVTTSVAVLRIALGRSCIVDRVRAEGSQESLIWLDRCYDCDVVNCEVWDVDPNISTNYGLSLSNNQRVRVSRLSGTTTRHPITVGGADRVGSVPSRELLFEQCEVNGVLATAFGGHGNMEWYSIKDCVMNGGVTLSGDHGSIEGCRLNNSGFATGRGLIFSELIGVDFVVADTDLRVTLITPGTPAVDWNTNTAADTVQRPGGQFRFTNFRIFGSDQDLLLSLLNRSAENDVSVIFEGCEFRRITTDGAGAAVVRVSGNPTSSSWWRKIEWIDCNFVGCGPESRDLGAQYVRVANCRVRQSQAHGIRITETASVAADFPWGGSNGFQEIEVSQNFVDEAQESGIWIDGWEETITRARVISNVSVRNRQGGAGSSNLSGSLFARRMEFCQINENTFGDDQAVPTQTRLYAVDLITLLAEGSNLRIGTIIAVNETNITQRISRVAELPNAIGNRRYEGWGTAAPTTGTWNQGDVVLNRQAAIGSPQGWRCTAAGTPGTWVAMPNL